MLSSSHITSSTLSPQILSAQRSLQALQIQKARHPTLILNAVEKSAGSAAIDEDTVTISESNSRNQSEPQSALSEEQALSDAEKKQVTQLKNRDSEVRRHEQTHLAALGAYRSGGPSYEFATGPDGRRYAVEGSVPVDVSAIADDPDATLQKAQAVRRAALAPTNPSNADRRVAAQASQLAFQARADIQKENIEERESGTQNQDPRLAKAIAAYQNLSPES
jgi:hypothetical protein